MDNINNGISEENICIVAPTWDLLYPFCNKLQILLPNVNFNSPDITPIKRDPLNVFYNVSRLILTKPSIKRYLYRKVIAEKIITELRDSFQINLELTPEQLLNIILHSKTNDSIGDKFIINTIDSIFNKLGIIIGDYNNLNDIYTYFLEKMESRINNVKYNLVNSVTVYEKMFQEKTGVVINTCHGVKGEEYETVIAFGLLKGKIPHISVCDTEQEKFQANKLLYVICSRAKENIYLFSETGRTNYKKEKLIPTKQLITNI